jgi:hypothetical protein
MGLHLLTYSLKNAENMELSQGRCGFALGFDMSLKEIMPS